MARWGADKSVDNGHEDGWVSGRMSKEHRSLFNDCWLLCSRYWICHGDQTRMVRGRTPKRRSIFLPALFFPKELTK